MFHLIILIAALTPVLLLMVLPSLGQSVEENRKSYRLLFSIFFIWLIALYLALQVGLGSKLVFLAISFPALLTFQLFFRDSFFSKPSDK